MDDLEKTWMLSSSVGEFAWLLEMNLKFIGKKLGPCNCIAALLSHKNMLLMGKRVEISVCTC